LAVTFNEVRRGQLDVRIGNCLGLLAGTLIRCYRSEEMTINVKPATNEPPRLSEEMKQQILARVRARHAQEAQQVAPALIGVKELPPSLNGPNGESIAHAG
jgi:hypothetical protein